MAEPPGSIVTSVGCPLSRVGNEPRQVQGTVVARAQDLEPVGCGRHVENWVGLAVDHGRVHEAFRRAGRVGRYGASTVGQAVVGARSGRECGGRAGDRDRARRTCGRQSGLRREEPGTVVPTAEARWPRLGRPGSGWACRRAGTRGRRCFRCWKPGSCRSSQPRSDPGPASCGCAGHEGLVLNDQGNEVCQVWRCSAEGAGDGRSCQRIFFRRVKQQVSGSFAGIDVEAGDAEAWS